MASNKLEEAAIAYRNTLIAINNYNNEDGANNYTSKHNRALADELSPFNGKGTGIFMDTYNGGSDIDVNGNPTYGGSGRLAAFANNSSLWGYGPENHYGIPDTS